MLLKNHHNVIKSQSGIYHERLDNETNPEWVKNTYRVRADKKGFLIMLYLNDNDFFTYSIFLCSETSFIKKLYRVSNIPIIILELFQIFLGGSPKEIFCR